MVNDLLEVIVESVVPRYGLGVSGVSPLDERSLLLDTNRGMKVLRIDTDEQKVERRHALWEHFAKRGVRRIPRHIRTLYGDAFVVRGGHFYTVSDLWEGRVPDLDPHDVRHCGRHLAELHRAAKGLQLNEPIKLPMRHGTWMERFAQAGDELHSRYCAWSELRQTNRLQERFLTHYEWLAEQIARAVEGLSAGKYQDLSRRSEAECEFAIGDYRLRELRIGEAGRVAILHVDDAISDLPLYDAARFAHLLLERGEQELAREFLDAYGEEAGMSEQQLIVLDAYLAFPHTAYRHLTQFRTMKRGDDLFAERFERAVEVGRARKPIVYGADGARWM